MLTFLGRQIKLCLLFITQIAPFTDKASESARIQAQQRLKSKKSPSTFSLAPELLLQVFCSHTSEAEQLCLCGA